MAEGWKRAVEWAAARSGVLAVKRRQNAPSGVILSYHNVVPEGEPPVGDRSLHIDQKVFASQLELLGETHEIVTLDELVANRTDGTRRRMAAITFDDAYLGAVTAGLDELTRRGLPSTIFVAPGILGSEGCWWDRLADRKGLLSPGVRRYALEELAGRQEPVLDWATRGGVPLLDMPPHARPVSVEGLLRHAARQGVSLGAHTWSHPNLPAISKDDCKDELSRSRAWVETNARDFSDWLAYPYGFWNEAVAKQAGNLFVGALRVDGGPAIAKGQRRGTSATTPRVNVPRGLSLDGLRLRLAGLLGAR